MKSLTLLKSILTDLQNKYHINIILKDFYSIIQTKPAFADLIHTFFSHENPYCLYIKDKPDAMTECRIAEHTRIGRKMNTNSSLYENGSIVTCPFGVREFYYPIFCSGHIIGALVAGCCPCSAEEFGDIFTVTDKFGFPPEKITEMYDRHIRPCSLPEDDHFWQQIALCGEVISMVCEKLLSDINIDCIFRYDFILNNANIFMDQDKELKGKRMIVRNNSSENRNLTIVINTINYIYNNYHSKITIEDIAKYCYCSSSTLSHVFAKNYGMTIGKLIHTVRCDRAKVLLSESSMSVSQIALECGFSSADYFTSVFKNLVGVTPTEYRLNGK